MNFSLPKSGFIANTLRLLFGNLSAQAINILTLPIITRLYSPDCYGVFTLFMSLSVLFQSVSCLNLEKAILLPKQEKDGFCVFFLCLFFVSVFSGLVLLIVLTINHTGVTFPKSYMSIVPYLYLFPVYIFFHGSSLALYFLLIRQNIFTIQPIARVSEVLSNRIISILYYYLTSSSPFGLIFSAISGAAITYLLLLKRNFIKIKQYLFDIDIHSMVKNFIRYKSFVLYSGSTLLEMFSREIIPVMCAFLFGPIIVGILGITSKVIRQPIGMLGDAIAKSFLQKISEAHRSAYKYDKYVFILFESLIQISLVPILLFSVISPEIFELFFGEQWRVAGVYFRVLSISYLVSFIYRPMSIIIDVQEKQRLRFGFNLLRAFLLILSLFCGAFFFKTPLHALGFYSAANVLTVSGYVGLILKYSGVQVASALWVVVRELSIGAGMVLLLLYIKFSFSLSFFIISALVGSMGIGYCASVMFRQRQLRKIVGIHKKGISVI